MDYKNIDFTYIAYRKKFAKLFEEGLVDPSLPKEKYNNQLFSSAFNVNFYNMNNILNTIQEKLEQFNNEKSQYDKVDVNEDGKIINKLINIEKDLLILCEHIDKKLKGRPKVVENDTEGQYYNTIVNILVDGYKRDENDTIDQAEEKFMSRSNVDKNILQKVWKIIVEEFWNDNNVGDQILSQIESQDEDEVKDE